MRRWPSPWQASQRPPDDVEGEAPGLVAALARLRQHGVELANVGEDAGVGRRIRARRASDGRLIDADDLVDVFGAGNGCGARRALRASGRACGPARDKECRSPASICPIRRRRSRPSSRPAENVTSRFFRLFSRAPRMVIACAVRLPALVAHGDLLSSGDVLRR